MKSVNEIFCRFHSEMVCLYLGMKWMLQSVSGLKHGESVRISRHGCQWSEHDWWKKKLISVKLSIKQMCVLM